MIYYCIYKDSDGTIKSGVYDGLEQYYKNTFSPCCQTCEIIPFQLSGKSYEEKKADAIDKAQMIQYGASIAQDLSYLEFSVIQDQMTKWARRYGLINEFRENCII